MLQVCETVRKQSAPGFGKHAHQQPPFEYCMVLSTSHIGNPDAHQPCLFYIACREDSRHLGKLTAQHTLLLKLFLRDLQQDPRDMVEIFTGRMPFLFGALLQDPALVQLLSQLLVQASVSRHVAPILLQYLVEHRLKDLEKPSSKVTCNLMAASPGVAACKACWTLLVALLPLPLPLLLALLPLLLLVILL